MLTRDTFLVGSRWSSPAGRSTLDVVSPITEEVIGTVPQSTNEDIDAAVTVARRAYDMGSWPRLSVRDRGHFLVRMTDLLRPRLEELVRLQIDEMGSPYLFMRDITQRWLNSIHQQIETAAGINTRQVRDSGMWSADALPGGLGKVVVFREPMGVVASIIPWNGPVGMLMSKIVPALLTGCPIIVKPAPETPLSAYIVAEAAVEAGLPEGVLSVIAGEREVGEHLVTHPGVDKVSFTGSSLAGRRVAALCGQQLKRATLELGGKSAAIVLEDADLDRDLPNLVASSFANNGQVCFATTRILAPRGRSAELVERLVAAVGEMRVGNPHDENTEFGPLVAERQRVRVENYIDSGRQQGAKVALGGGRPEHLPKGWYVDPTIFVGVDNSMTIAQEEIFGPVVCVIDYDSEDEAIAIANTSEYGLGGAVFTRDIEHGLEIAAQIKTGTCRINEAIPGGGGGPFGGVKQSGLGREYDREGFEGYYELKSVALPAGFELP